jgi:hypothetical protein
LDVKGHIAVIVVSFLTSVLAVSPCFAKFKGDTGRAGHNHTRITLGFGLFSQDFAGVDGAKFSRINHYQYNASLLYLGKRWSHGLRYMLIPNLKFQPFKFSNNVEGAYKVEFKRLEYLVGVVSKRFRYYLVLGTETSVWKGVPEPAKKSKTDLHYGAELSYDLYTSAYGTKDKIIVPLVLSYIGHLKRKIEFTNFPNDPVTVNAGAEFGIGTGVAFDF